MYLEEQTKQRITKILESGNYNEIVIELEQMIHDDPSDVDAKVLLGLSYIQASQPDKAIKVLEEVSNEFESNPIICHFLGHAYLATGQLEKAKESLEKSVHEDSGNLSALYDLALTLFHLGEYKNAIDYLVIGLKNFNNAVVLHKLAGDVCLLLGDYERAIHHWNEALPAKIDAENILHNIALAHILSSEFEKAVDVLDDALILAPNDIDIKCTKGLALSRLNRFDEAKEILLSVLEEDPVHFNALLFLSQIYYYEGDIKTSNLYYNKAMNLMDNDSDKLFIAALSFRHCKEYEEAVSFLRIAVDQLPNVPIFRQELAKTYYYMNKFDESHSELIKLFELRGYLKVQCSQCKTVLKIRSLNDSLKCPNCNSLLKIPENNYWK